MLPDWMFSEDQGGGGEQQVDRPKTGYRPGERPMTGRLGSARAVPGTASRLVETAMKNRPASRAGIGLHTAVSVAERPITQQGLTGLKTGAGGRGPQVGDLYSDL